MREKRRALLPLAISLALVVGLGAPPVVAQDEVATPAAGINADKVDGRDAVKATKKKQARKNKLVATDSKGFLPNNILKPLWRLMTGIPAALADDQISWGELLDIPAGFADGIDNVGYASATDPTVFAIGVTPAELVVTADAPVGTDLELSIIPAPGSYVEIVREVTAQGPNGALVPSPLAAGFIRRLFVVKNLGAATTFRVRTRVFDTGIAPAALKKAPNKIKVSVGKVPRKLRSTR